MYLGIAIIRVPNGFDYSNLLEEESFTVQNGTEVPASTPIGEVNDTQNASQMQGRNIFSKSIIV